MARRDKRTLDLFCDWQPPEVPKVEVSFDDRLKPFASIESGRIARAVATTLKDCAENHGQNREAVRAKMARIGGQELSIHMLNSWASESKTEHVISLRWAFAFILATGDARLLSLGLEQSDFAVIPRKHLGDIEHVLLKEQIEALQDQLKLVERKRRGP